MIDFQSIVGKTADEISTLSPFPVGAYVGVITQVAHLQTSKNHTDCIAFGVKPIEVIEASYKELEEFGDWQNYEFKPMAMVSPLTFFMTSEAAASFLIATNRKTKERSGFLVDVCQLPSSVLNSGLPVWAEDENGAPMDSLCLSAVGSMIEFTVGHKISESGRTYAVIKTVSRHQ